MKTNNDKTLKCLFYSFIWVILSIGSTIAHGYGCGANCSSCSGEPTGCNFDPRKNNGCDCQY